MPAETSRETRSYGFGPLYESVCARFTGVPIWLGQTTQASTLHLFHAANSICSQKVRAVLAQTHRSYVSHLLDILTGDTYDPAYVRLRVEGCDAAGLPLTDRHPGATSVAKSGCDPCVVPTLLDCARDEILVDSRRICMELDRRNPIAPGLLVPDEHSEQIQAQLVVIDDLPNYQLLAVTVGTSTTGAVQNGFAISKVGRCERLLAAHGSDPTLRAAYTAKRTKEQMAADRLFEVEAMENARQLIANAITTLDADVAASGGPWLFGSSVTMADLFWGVELIRNDDLGLSALWADGRLPNVAAYYRRLCALPSLAKAVLDWPGARLTTPLSVTQ